MLHFNPCTKGCKPFKFKNITGLSLVMAALILPFTSCVKDKFNDLEVNYDASFAIPIATVETTLSDMIENDTLLSVDNENGIGLVFREQNVFNITAEDLLDEVKGELTQSFYQNTTVGQIAIDDIHQELDVQFGELLENFQDPVFRTFLEQNDGEYAPIPSFTENVQSDFGAPPLDDFSQMSIANGMLSLRVTNNLFFDLGDFSVTTVDNITGQVIGTFYYDFIATGETETETMDLAGKTIHNDLKVIINSIQTPGTGGNQVLIDLAKTIDFEYDVTDVVIESGEVALPAGQLTMDDLNFGFNTSNGERFYSMIVDDISVGYSIRSDINTNVKMVLRFPGVLKNNEPLVHELLISPTGPNDSIVGNLDFTNTTWLLDQDIDQPYNRWQVEYEVLIENPDGNLVAFSADDAVTMLFSISGIELAEVRGFFGQRLEAFEEEEVDPGVDFSFLGGNSSPLYFDNPVLRLQIRNSFGVPLAADFNATASGHFGTQATLDPPQLDLNYPGLSNFGETVVTDYVLDKNNSNIVNLLSIYPNLLHFSGSAFLNPDNDDQEINYVTAGSELSADLEFDLPFRLQVENLVYRDTGEAVDLDLGENLSIDDISEAELKIVYTNELPVATSVRIIALYADGSEQLVINNIDIEPATVDADGKVPAGNESTGENFVLLSNEQLHQLDNAVKNIYEVRFQTTGGGQVPVAFYTDYKIRAGLGLKVTFDR